MGDETLVMGSEEKLQARQRSLQSLHPPRHVPGFEQEQFLGKGAFGEVWVATDINTGRPVAIKFYSRGAGMDWSLLAQEVEKLRHLFTDRYVVQLLAIGADASPPYFVMEYMENGSLEDVLRDGPMPVAQAVAFFRDVVVGLVHAHGKGILHCDIKPANILLDQDGKPRLADFGQARLPHEHSPSLGTLFYMAPEQADLKALPDVRWDVYALGAVLYRMLTGELPYADAPTTQDLSKSGPLAERLDRYRQLLRNTPPPAAHHRIPDVDSALAALVDRCLAVDPHRRFPNVQAVLDALDARTLHRARRPLLVLGAAAPALVALVMIVAAGFLFRSFVSRSEGELVRRALESNHFAAVSVAERFALEVDKRWRILEQAAADPQLRERLQRMPDLQPGSPTRRETQQWLRTWIADWHTRSDAQFTPITRAVSWFVNDRTGIQAGRSPHDELTLDRNWAYRDYFHGQGKDFPPENVRALRPRPIRLPYRSLYYQSQASGAIRSAAGSRVAFSVPIWGIGGAGTDDPVGVLGMTCGLGRLGDVQGSRDQFAVLIDLRPSASGERGLIVEHPGMEKRLATVEAQPDWGVDREFLERADRLRNRKLQAQRLVMEDHPPGSLSPEQMVEADYICDYRDPLGNEFQGAWLASLAPVLITRGRGDVLDTGWMVVVQERPEDTIQPVRELMGSLLWRAVTAVLMVVVVVTGLWVVVMFLLDDPTRGQARVFWRRLGVPGSSASAPGSSGSQPHRLSAPPALAAATVKMDSRNPLSAQPNGDGP